MKSTKLFHHSNLGGDVPQLIDHRRYDAHGNVVPSGDTASIDTFTFDGSFDPAAGLQENMMRHFDPTVGEWMSEDPIGYAGDVENLRCYVGE
jgi:RHS repeat-associated protein